MNFNKSKLREILQKEKVLIIAAMAAVVSMFFVPPTMAYIDYIDVRVLSEAVKIDTRNKQVVVRDLIAGKEYSESYDYLVLSKYNK